MGRGSDFFMMGEEFDISKKERRKMTAQINFADLSKKESNVFYIQLDCINKN